MPDTRDATDPMSMNRSLSRHANSHQSHHVSIGIPPKRSHEGSWTQGCPGSKSYPPDASLPAAPFNAEAAASTPKQHTPALISKAVRLTDGKEIEISTLLKKVKAPDPVYMHPDSQGTILYRLVELLKEKLDITGPAEKG